MLVSTAAASFSAGATDEMLLDFGLHIKIPYANTIKYRLKSDYACLGATNSNLDRSWADIDR
jgi:hypothetical protein